MSASFHPLEIKNILLVDDDPDFADAVKNLLEAHNFVVTTVSNGADALHEVIALDFEVIICDMMMPEMPGDMLYLAVQKVKPHLTQRFLFITGHLENPKVEAFLRKIEALVLYKPVEIDDLVEMISLILRLAPDQANA